MNMQPDMHKKTDYFQEHNDGHYNGLGEYTSQGLEFEKNIKTGNEIRRKRLIYYREMLSCWPSCQRLPHKLC